MRARQPDDHGHIDSGGVRIAWERFGDAGPWILFVPTWHLVHARSWKMHVAHLARRFRVLTYDPRGNGASDRPARGYRIEDHAADALAVLDHHGVQRAAVVSASMGSNHALWLALEHPHRVERLVLIGAAIGAVYPRGLARHIEADYEAFVGGFFAASFSEPHSTKPIEDAIGWARETTPAVIAAGLADYDPGLVEPRLGEVAQPTLVVHGDDDRIIALDRARALADAIPGAELVVVRGGGHRPDMRDPVLHHRAVDGFLGDGARRAPVRELARGPAPGPRRALFVSSPIGLGHVHRDLAIAAALRERRPDLEIDWLAQEPATSVLRAAGETIHPASAELAGEVAHIESHAGEHSLPVFRAWREMDEILAANFMVFHDAVRATRYDLWIGDEAWEVDHYLHENPDLKTAPYAFLTDFVGWLPMSDEEAPIVASHNAEMVAQVQRHPWVRDAALFLGDPEDVIDRPFGPGLPSIPAWVAERFEFPGYVLPRERSAPARPDGPPLVVAAVGGTASGTALLRRVLEAFALLRRDVPEARLLAVGGPRIDAGALTAPDGATLAGFVEDLPQRLAGSDLAVVQGGLATTMELLAARRPFVWVPLREHCEQQLHVAHRLRRLGAPPPTAYEQTSPEALAATMLERLGADVRYAAVDPGGAQRAADAIAALLQPATRRRAGAVAHPDPKQRHATHP